MFATHSPAPLPPTSASMLKPACTPWTSTSWWPCCTGGALGAIASARGAMARGDVLGKCNGISKAIRIIEEGLNTGLDRVDGGELAENLGSLYGYCVRRLTLANARNDDAMMQEVQRLIEPVAQAWMDMKGAAAPAEAVDSTRSVLQEA